MKTTIEVIRKVQRTLGGRFMSGGSLIVSTC